MRTTEGRRFERFARDHWTGEGGMRGLCKEAGITPETLYRWFRGGTDPDLGSVRQLASALKVNRAELVAAIDGQLPPPNFQADLAEAVKVGIAQVLQEQGLVLRREARRGRQPEDRPAARRSA